MEIGKLAGNKLKNVILDEIDHFRTDVLVAAGTGEDSSVVDLGEELLVISSDPITGAENKAGFIAVNVACNDIAAAGADPIGIQVVLLLPSNLGYNKAQELMQEIVSTAKSMDVEVLGGHTEITDVVNKAVIVITSVGKAKKEELCSSADAEAGNILYISKTMGIEGSYILANDYKDHLIKKGVSRKTLLTVSNFLELLTVIPESRLARKNYAKAMHDVTEGGVYGAVAELAAAAELGYIIEKDNFKVKAEIKEICDKLELDPAGLISSGSMLIAAEENSGIEEVFAKNNIELLRVGRLIEKGSYIEEEGELKEFSPPEEDELWRFIKKITNTS